MADTRWGNGGWVHREFQMPENLPDHLALRDGSDDPCEVFPPLCPWTAPQVLENDFWPETFPEGP